MEFIVSDACIFIDLIEISLIKEFFALPFEFYTTDFVVNEITNLKQLSLIKEIIDLRKLNVLGTAPDDLYKIIQTSVNHPKLSVSDCSVFYFGKKNNFTVLTNDKRLRKLCKKIRVHGILWIFDTLISNRIISKAQATEKLRELMEINQRLPLDECLKKIKKWSG
jgi:rRNA-processing protein FCF1